MHTAEISCSKERFNCEICHKSFSTTTNLYRHWRIHLKNCFLTCARCQEGFMNRQLFDDHKCGHKAPCKNETLGKLFTSKEQPPKHFQICFGLKVWPCDLCKSVFPSEFGLSVHKRKHFKKDTKHKVFYCRICHQRFTCKFSLSKHYIVCYRENTIACEMCPKNFESEDHLKEHRLTHYKSFVCDHCNKCFSSEADLLVHREVCLETASGEKCQESSPSTETSITLQQAGEKPFPCDMCEKSFVTKSGLRKHQVCCHKEKQFTCEMCQKSFCSYQRLKAHGKTHTGEKPFTCEQCQKSFASSYTLRTHEKVHADSGTYSCKSCNCYFTTSLALERHEKERHFKLHFVCEFCGMSQPSLSDLQLHRQHHFEERPFKCSFCGQDFLTQSVLNTHEKKHYSIAYTCNTCQKTYSSFRLYVLHKREHFPTANAHMSSAKSKNIFEQSLNMNNVICAQDTKKNSSPSAKQPKNTKLLLPSPVSKPPTKLRPILPNLEEFRLPAKSESKVKQRKRILVRRERVKKKRLVNIFDFDYVSIEGNPDDNINDTKYCKIKKEPKVTRKRKAKTKTKTKEVKRRNKKKPRISLEIIKLLDTSEECNMEFAESDADGLQSDQLGFANILTQNTDGILKVSAQCLPPNPNEPLCVLKEVNEESPEMAVSSSLIDGQIRPVDVFTPVEEDVPQTIQCLLNSEKAPVNVPILVPSAIPVVTTPCLLNDHNRLKATVLCLPNEQVGPVNVLGSIEYNPDDDIISKVNRQSKNYTRKGTSESEKTPEINVDYSQTTNVKIVDNFGNCNMEFNDGDDQLTFANTLSQNTERTSTIPTQCLTTNQKETLSILTKVKEEILEIADSSSLIDGQTRAVNIFTQIKQEVLQTTTQCLLNSEREPVSVPTPVPSTIPVVTTPCLPSDHNRHKATVQCLPNKQVRHVNVLEQAVSIEGNPDDIISNITYHKKTPKINRWSKNYTRKGTTDSKKTPEVNKDYSQATNIKIVDTFGNCNMEFNDGDDQLKFAAQSTDGTSTISTQCLTTNQEGPSCILKKVKEEILEIADSSSLIDGQARPGNIFTQVKEEIPETTIQCISNIEKGPVSVPTLAPSAIPVVTTPCPPRDHNRPKTIVKQMGTKIAKATVQCLPKKQVRPVINNITYRKITPKINRWSKNYTKKGTTDSKKMPEVNEDYSLATNIKIVDTFGNCNMEFNDGDDQLTFANTLAQNTDGTSTISTQCLTTNQEGPSCILKKVKKEIPEIAVSSSLIDGQARPGNNFTQAREAIPHTTTQCLLNSEKGPPVTVPMLVSSAIPVVTTPCLPSDHNTPKATVQYLPNKQVRHVNVLEQAVSIEDNSDDDIISNITYHKIKLKVNRRSKNNTRKGTSESEKTPEVNVDYFQTTNIKIVDTFGNCNMEFNDGDDQLKFAAQNTDETSTISTQCLTTNQEGPLCILKVKEEIPEITDFTSLIDDQKGPVNILTKVKEEVPETTAQCLHNRENSPVSVPSLVTSVIPVVPTSCLPNNHNRSITITPVEEEITKATVQGLPNNQIRPVNLEPLHQEIPEITAQYFPSDQNAPVSVLAKIKELPELSVQCLPNNQVRPLNILGQINQDVPLVTAQCFPNNQMQFANTFMRLNKEASMLTAQCLPNNQTGSVILLGQVNEKIPEAMAQCVPIAEDMPFSILGREIPKMTSQCLPNEQIQFANILTQVKDQLSMVTAQCLSNNQLTPLNIIRPVNLEIPELSLQYLPNNQLRPMTIFTQVNQEIPEVAAHGLPNDLLNSANVLTQDKEVPEVPEECLPNVQKEPLMLLGQIKQEIPEVATQCVPNIEDRFVDTHKQVGEEVAQCLPNLVKPLSISGQVNGRIPETTDKSPTSDQMEFAHILTHIKKEVPEVTPNVLPNMKKSAIPLWPVKKEIPRITGSCAPKGQIRYVKIVPRLSQQEVPEVSSRYLGKRKPRKKKKSNGRKRIRKDSLPKRTVNIFEHYLQNIQIKKGQNSP